MAVTLNPENVTMYSSRFCPFCIRAHHILGRKTKKLNLINVDGNGSIREELRAKTGSHTVPQIWIGETYVGGCDDLIALDKKDQLDPLLDAL